MNKRMFKSLILLIIIGILFYRFTDHPQILFEFLNFMGTLLNPFFIGLFIALLANPVIKWFSHYLKLPKSLSILCAYLLGVILISLCLLILIPSLIVGINDLFVEVTAYIHSPEKEKWMKELMQSTPYIEQLLKFAEDNIQNITKSIISLVNSVSTSLLSSIIGWTSQIFNVIFGITISIYLIIDQQKVLKAFDRFITVYFPTYSQRLKYFIRFTYHTFQDYIVGRLLDSFIIGVIAFVGFYLLKSPYVALFAFIVFITNIIPYFGPIIGAIIPIGMTFLIDPLQSLWIALFILFLQQLDGNVIGPKIMGDCVGLSPLWVISVVILGGSLFGFIGFFLAVPVAAVLKELYEHLLHERMQRLATIHGCDFDEVDLDE